MALQGGLTLSFTPFWRSGHVTHSMMWSLDRRRRCMHVRCGTFRRTNEWTNERTRRFYVGVLGSKTSFRVSWYVNWYLRPLLPQAVQKKVRNLTSSDMRKFEGNTSQTLWPDLMTLCEPLRHLSLPPGTPWPPSSSPRRFLGVNVFCWSNEDIK